MSELVLTRALKPEAGGQALSSPSPSTPISRSILLFQLCPLCEAHHRAGLLFLDDQWNLILLTFYFSSSDCSCHQQVSRCFFFFFLISFFLSTFQFACLNRTQFQSVKEQNSTEYFEALIGFIKLFMIGSILPNNYKGLPEGCAKQQDFIGRRVGQGAISKRKEKVTFQARISFLRERNGRDFIMQIAASSYGEFSGPCDKLPHWF